MFIPVRDDIPAIRTPHVTMALIGINILIFLFSKTLGPHGYSNFLTQFGYMPGLFMGGGQSYYGASSGSLLTPLSYMFLHGGWMHLIGNMIFLWFFGNKIEEYFGSVRFALFYLASGLGAAVLYTMFNLESLIPLVGASGAIAGIMGAYMVLYPRAEITCLIVFFLITFVTLRAKLVLGVYFGYNLLLALGGSNSMVAYMAHIGGFAFGWLLLKMLIKIWGRGGPVTKGQRYHRMQW